MFDLSTPDQPMVSSKSWKTANLLAWLGFILPAGMHRIYVGKVGTGILWMLSCGGLIVGQIVDIVKLNKGEFTDKKGLPVVKP